MIITVPIVPGAAIECTPHSKHERTNFWLLPALTHVRFLFFFEHLQRFARRSISFHLHLDRAVFVPHYSHKPDIVRLETVKLRAATHLLAVKPMRVCHIKRTWMVARRPRVEDVSRVGGLQRDSDKHHE